MQYLTWRVLSGLNKKIEISFMMVGHTKFAPDWAFGLLKQRFRKSVLGCLDDMVRVVNESASVNVAQLVGSESGNTFVRQYNWSDYFHRFYKRQAFDGIKSFHHLKFEQTRPGKVMVREVFDSEEKELAIWPNHIFTGSPIPTTCRKKSIHQGSPENDDNISSTKFENFVLRRAETKFVQIRILHQLLRLKNSQLHHHFHLLHCPRQTQLTSPLHLHLHLYHHQRDSATGTGNDITKHQFKLSKTSPL